MDADSHFLTVAALVLLSLVGMLLCLERSEAAPARTLGWMIVFVGISLVAILGGAHALP